LVAAATAALPVLRIFFGLSIDVEINILYAGLPRTVWFCLPHTYSSTWLSLSTARPDADFFDTIGQTGS